MAKDNILLIKMFAGGFNVDNIGHEIINYYLPDEGDEYHIFVPPYGNVDKRRKIKSAIMLEKTDISYILKAVAILKNLGKEDENDDFSNVHYGAKSLKDIVFSDEPKYKEMDETFHRSTFKCNEGDYVNIRNLNIYVVPAKKDDNCPFDEASRKSLIEKFKSKHKKENPRLIEFEEKKPWHNIGYLSEDDKDFLTIIDLIEKETASIRTNHQRVINNVIDGKDYNQDNLLRYIDKEYDENAVTSFMNSILNDSHELLKDFVEYLISDNNGKKESKGIISLKKQKLALTDEQIEVNKYVRKKDFDKNDKKYSDFSDEGKQQIDKKEQYQRGIMDLFIEDDNNVVAIENKIKSDLNGKYKLDDVEETQLNKYDDYLKRIANGKERYVIVISPDYNSEFVIEKELSAHFKQFTYSQLYEFFVGHTKTNENVNLWENKYALFLNVLKKHSMSLEEETHIRFKYTITRK